MLGLCVEYTWEDTGAIYRVTGMALCHPQANWKLRGFKEENVTEVKTKNAQTGSCYCHLPSGTNSGFASSRLLSTTPREELS